MAFNFNGNTPKKILYNGLNVAKLVYNGVAVWMSKVLATISGILPLTLTDCTGDDLVDYKIYGNSEYEGLPDGYTQVEYLESTGTQYIDAGIKATEKTMVKAKLYTEEAGNKNWFGGTGTPSVSYNFVFNSFRINQFEYSYGPSNWTTITISEEIVNKDFTVEFGNGAIKINDSLKVTLPNTAFTDNKNLCIFVRNGGIGKIAGRVYYLKIYEAGVLVRNFIPCINSSNVAGMYDTVTNTFYTNAGTGTFNTGSVVSKKSVGDLVTDTSDVNYGKYKIPVLTNSTATNIYLNKPLRKTSKLPIGYTQIEHIRSTGTQYIDTGRKMYNNSEIELCFSFDDMQQDCSIFGSCTSSTANNFEIASIDTSSPIYLDFGNFNTSRATYNNAVINTKYICTISKSLRAVYDENRTLLASNTTLISADNVTPSNARIFDTAGGYSTKKLKGKVYYCKIWENGVLVRNMIPCKNQSNVIGMYDTANDVFYSNAGSGSFIAGAEVETVYYTDYLDYKNQKVVRNVDDNDKGLDTSIEESVVLPTVATDEGTVTVDVDTLIAPSHAEIKYYKNGS